MPLLANRRWSRTPQLGSLLASRTSQTTPVRHGGRSQQEARLPPFHRLAEVSSMPTLGDRQSSSSAFRRYSNQSMRSVSPSSVSAISTSSSILSRYSNQSMRPVSTFATSVSASSTSSSISSRYSNQSMRSVSTFATSVSASSASTNWRRQSDSRLEFTSSLPSLNSNNGPQSIHINGMPRRLPVNVKRMYFCADKLPLPGIHLLTGCYYSTKRCSVGAPTAAGARTQAYCTRQREGQTAHDGYGRQKCSRIDK